MFCHLIYTMVMERIAFDEDVTEQFLAIMAWDDSGERGAQEQDQSIREAMGGTTVDRMVADAWAARQAALADIEQRKLAEQRAADRTTAEV